VLAAVMLAGLATASMSCSRAKSSDDCRPIPLARVVTYPDGGKAYVYKNGLAQAVPPAGFDPIRASSAQLARYGFPPRPRDPERLAAWVKRFSGIKEHASAGICQTNRRNGTAP
jgi:hypothetical protein